MHAVSENKYRLVITHHSARLARVLAALGLAFALLAGGRFFAHSGTSEPFWGAVGAAVTMLLGAAAVFERSRVVVDASTGLVNWHRRRVFGSKSGTLAFSQVKGVVSERAMGDDDGLRRVVLHTDRGDVPVTVAYLPDPHDVALGLALKIRLMIGLGDRDMTVPEEVRKLAAEGKTLAAIKTLRQRRGGSLRDAHATVQSLTRRS